MKKAVLVLLLMSLALSGCSMQKKAGRRDEKPEVREYKDEAVKEPELAELSVTDGHNEPAGRGEPMTYGDFAMGDENYIKDRIVKNQRIFCYSYKSAYDENGEWEGGVGTAGRMEGWETPYEIAEEHGTEVKAVNFEEDKIWQYAVLLEDNGILQNFAHAASYCDAKYYLPESSGSLGYYAGLRFYFDADDVLILIVLYENDDMMPLDKIYYDDFYSGVQWNFVPPAGHTLTPKIQLKGMTDFFKLYKDEAYPVFTFGESEVTIEWKRPDGTPAEGVGALKDITSVGYTVNGNSIDFDLPEGADNNETYILYNTYLDAYEFHDKYWRDNYECALLMYR